MELNDIWSPCDIDCEAETLQSLTSSTARNISCVAGLEEGGDTADHLVEEARKIHPCVLCGEFVHITTSTTMPMITLRNSAMSAIYETSEAAAVSLDQARPLP